MTESAHVGVSDADLAAIEATARDYLDGYVTGDGERHRDAYHSEAVKRRYTTGEDGIARMVALSPEMMADFAATEEGRPGASEIIIDAAYHDVASVRVYSERWVDFLHIVKARDEWKILHVTWFNREG